MIIAHLQVAAFVVGCVILGDGLFLLVVGAIVKWRERRQ